MPKAGPEREKSSPSAAPGDGRFEVRVKPVCLAFREPFLVLTTRDDDGRARLPEFAMSAQRSPTHFLDHELSGLGLRPVLCHLMEAEHGAEEGPLQLILDYLVMLGSEAVQPKSSAALIPFDEAQERLPSAHAHLLVAARHRAIALLEDVGLAVDLIGQPFTLAELRTVYATASGRNLNPSNFARSILKTGVGWFQAEPADAKRNYPHGRPATVYTTHGPAPRFRLEHAY